MNFYMLNGALFVLFIFSLGVKISKNPGQINNIFAYRSGRSICNVDTWLEANAFAGRCLMVLGTIFLLLLLLVGNDFANLQHLFIAIIFCFVSCIFTTIFFTEKYLKRKFFKDGKRKPTEM